MKFSPKHLAMSVLFSRWPRPCPFEEGYSVLLPSPMDMPFLLRYALEGLARIDTTNCKEIIVLPDGWGDDDGDALDEVVRGCADPRVSLLRLTPFDKFVTGRMRRTDGAGTHWVMAVRGTNRARCAHAFLHDADAFFLETDGLERQYRECRDRGMYTLGVTARLDPLFREAGYTIPGTWELMYSTRWARSRSPYALKGLVRPTDRGPQEFDSMLYPQYLDFPSGKVGVMEPPPGLAHFSGTIVTYRAFRGGVGRIDQFFRILLLSILEELIPSADGERVVPTVSELARGLESDDAPVSYTSVVASEQYPIFRDLLEQLCESPVFAGDRAARVRELVAPFDAHFQNRVAAAAAGESVVRYHGLG